MAACVLGAPEVMLLHRALYLGWDVGRKCILCLSHGRHVYTWETLQESCKVFIAITLSDGAINMESDALYLTDITNFIVFHTVPEYV